VRFPGFRYTAGVDIRDGGEGSCLLGNGTTPSFKMYTPSLPPSSRPKPGYRAIDHSGLPVCFVAGTLSDHVKGRRLAFPLGTRPSNDGMVRMVYLPGRLMKTTRYFEEHVLRKRAYIRREWCESINSSVKLGSKGV